MAKWIADHRLQTRLVLLAIDAAVLILFIENLRSSSRHWPSVVIFIVWLGLTANAGWLFPKQVDTWRKHQQSLDAS